MPHVAARSFADRDRLADFLWRLTSRARVDRVLLVGGNRRKPIGAFETALDVLETGLIQEFGIRRVGLAGHPEGHPEVAPDVIAAALRDKLAYGREAGLETGCKPAIAKSCNADVNLSMVPVKVSILAAATIAARPMSSSNP